MGKPGCLSMPDVLIIEHRLLDEHTFLLLDMAHVKTDFWRSLPGIPIVPRELVDKVAILPRLVTIAELDQAQRGKILDALLAKPNGRSLPAAALLATDASADRIIVHLRSRMIVSPPAQEKIWFRFYDPRVFRHLLWMATPDQLATLFGPTRAWTWRDAQGSWHRSSPPPDGQAALQFLARDLDFVRIRWLEQCLQVLREDVPGFVDDPDNQQARRVNALIDAALAHGLSDEADVRLYVTQAVRFHPQIHHHPELVLRLRAVADDDSYVGACSNLDADTLSRYASEMSHLRKEHIA
jgi:Domain of unknown function (DUF4123)